MVLLEQQKAESPEIVIRRHGLVIFETIELERIKSTEFNKELRKLDLPDANWNRYRGLGGDEIAHPITIGEQAELLREVPDGWSSSIGSKLMRPVGGGKAFRGYERSWFVEDLREDEPCVYRKLNSAVLMMKAAKDRL